MLAILENGRIGVMGDLKEIFEPGKVRVDGILSDNFIRKPSEDEPTERPADAEKTDERGE